VRGNKGFALVLVLVVTALMVAVTVELIHQVYVDTSLSRGFRDSQQASLVAESGITAGKQYMNFMFSGKDHTWMLDPVTQDDETGTITISITEESGKINLNILAGSNGVFDKDTHNALKRLGKQLGILDDVWDSLADWLDSNDDARSGSAETPYYQTQKPPYRARNGQLRTIDELLLVKGFTAEIVAKLKPFVTVYSDQISQKININTASAEVIAALSDSLANDPGMVKRIIAERRITPFKPADTISKRIAGTEALTTELANILIYKGTVFRITSVSKVKDSARTVQAVVLMGKDNVLSWQEY